jgi:uncharacterized protein
MLIEFSVGNYRSFKERVTFSMVAANLAAKQKELDENNVFAIDKNLKLLKSAAIYGANASGKSNLAKALGFMLEFMINSSKDTQSTDAIDIEPFRLSVDTEAQPSYFELVFLMEDQRYRYGFEVNHERVVSEWLFYVPTTRETKLFERQLDTIKASRVYAAEGVQKRTRSNALFLSVSAQFNVEFADRILRWLDDKWMIISSVHEQSYANYTVNCLIENENRAEIIQLIRMLDLGIDGIALDQHDLTLEDLPDELGDELKEHIIKLNEGKATSISIAHRKFNRDGTYSSIESFDLAEQESEGTQKIVALAGPLVAALQHGNVFVIDEFDASLHPLISHKIVELFNSQETNPNNAQLIFMTHDINLLNHRILRRDQIWFTEKNKYGATNLYSLAEYKIRNDASFESDYIKGRYGAIPYIGHLPRLTHSSNA